MPSAYSPKSTVGTLQICFCPHNFGFSDTELGHGHLATEGGLEVAVVLGTCMGLQTIGANPRSFNHVGPAGGSARWGSNESCLRVLLSPFEHIQGVFLYFRGSVGGAGFWENWVSLNC